MCYFKFTATTPYCGTDHEEYIKFEDRPTEDDLNNIAEDICHNNAESFEYLLTGWGGSDFDELSEEEQQEALDNYYADCSCTWEEITKEEYEENL